MQDMQYLSYSELACPDLWHWMHIKHLIGSIRFDQWKPFYQNRNLFPNPDLLNGTQPFLQFLQSETRQECNSN